MPDIKTIRLDKWLWTARFYKTRKLAAEAISGGKVHLNGQRSKPGKDVKIEKVTDLMKIAGYGVFGTPAVVVDGEVKSVGKIPKKEEIVSWIIE